MILNAPAGVTAATGLSGNKYYVVNGQADITDNEDVASLIGAGWAFPNTTSIPSPADYYFNAGDKRPEQVNMIGFGDSRTYLNFTNLVWPWMYAFQNGVINVAQSLTNHRYRWVPDFQSGVSGDTAQGLDTRKATAIPAIMAKRPANEEWDLCYWVDINDAIAGISASAFLGYFRSTMKYLLGIGIKNIFVLSGLPYATGYGGETAAQHAARIALIKAYNAGMSDFCSKTPGLHFVDSYADYGQGTDDSVVGGNTDIHPGSIGATVVALNLAEAWIAARGKFTTAPGIPISPNPYLTDVETFTADNQAIASYYSTVFTNAKLTRDAVDGALIVECDASNSATSRTFNIFNNTGDFIENGVANANTVMPGDIVQGCLDIEYLDVIGLPQPAWIKIQSAGGRFAYGNSQAYTNGILLGVGRQVFLTPELYIGTGQASVEMRPYFNLSVAAGTKVRVKVNECSCRRVYTSPNAEYSAAATIPLHRKNIKCLTNTAAGSFALTLPPLALTNDGDVWVIQDMEGNASVKTVTLTGNASENIKAIGASAANTLVLNTNNFSRKFRADRGVNAWVEF